MYVCVCVNTERTAVVCQRIVKKRSSSDFDFSWTANFLVIACEEKKSEKRNKTEKTARNTYLKRKRDQEFVRFLILIFFSFFITVGQ